MKAGDPIVREDGTTSMLCVVDRGADPGPELGQRLLRAGIAVQELKAELPTLEEYFHAVTEGSDRAEEEALAAQAEAATEVSA